MSHFTTLVVIREAEGATDAEAQLNDILDPFDENKEMTPYARWLDQEQVDRAVEFYREHPEFCTPDGDGPVKPFDEYIGDGDLDAWHTWVKHAVGGYEAGGRDDGIYDADGDRYGYMSTYNPDSKWDWWTLGGRWHGAFKLKESVSVGGRRHPFPPIGDNVDATLPIPSVKDQDAILGPAGTGGDAPGTDLRGLADLARKGDIDIEGMRDDAEKRANEVFDKIEAACGTDWPEPQAFRWFFENETERVLGNRDADYKDFMSDSEDHDLRRKEFDKQIRQPARDAYHAQPVIKALQEADLLGWFSEPVEDFCLREENPREAYVHQQRLAAMAQYSMVIDGQWLARGEMGWFGMSHDDQDYGAWLLGVNGVVDQLPDDAWLAVVDCHI